jgi:hypothetical protein
VGAPQADELIIRHSVDLTQTALMLPTGPVSQPRERIGTTRISQKRRERPRQGYRRSWLPIGYPRGRNLVDLTGIEPVTS